MDVNQAFAELGLSLSASQAEAKSAYRTLAMRWHPDVNASPDADARMKSINVAYERACQHIESLALAAAQACHASNARPANSAAKAGSGFAEFDWKTGFKPAAAGFANMRAERLQRTLQVSLFEAAFGCVKRVSGMVPDACARCGGSGEFPGAWTLGSKCVKCFGRGVFAARGCSGAIGRTTHCDACQGTGVFKPTAPACPHCKGTGQSERKAWMVDVRIPAGTLDGAEVQPGDIRVRSGAHLLPRKLVVTVQLEKHPIFQLDQDRLSVSVPISVWKWTLGGAILVPTLDGSTRVSLPVRPAAVMVKHQGWPLLDKPDQRRPLFVIPKVVYPDSLGDEERRMLQALDARARLPEVDSWNRSAQAWMESAAQDLG